MRELQKRGLVMGNSSSWSSSVVGANDEEPSRGNEVGGEAGAGETRKRKSYGKVRDHLSWFQRKGEEAAQKA